ncbi:hypothetical protein D3C79_947490 [compost metagenome]
MPKKWLKYARQITTPLSSNTSMHTNNVQNSSFCPALYLPIGGTPSSLLSITRSMRRSHRRSLAVMKLARQKRTTRNRKNTNMATPMKGCRMRVHGPPPNRWLSQNSAGWNSASPESPASTNRMATIQWLVRSLAL